MRLSRILAAGVVSGMALSAGVAAAQDITLYHDKYHWPDGFAAAEEAAQQELGYTFEDQPYSPPDQYQAFIQSSIAGGDTPQMFTWWTGSTLQEIARTGRVADLSALWDEKIEQGEYSAGVEELFQVDGKTYAVPQNISRWVVFYNKSMFEDAGIEGEPQTWDELMSAADSLKEAGHTPFVATVQDGWRGFIWFEELMIRSDPEAYRQLHTGELAYDSEPVQAVFDTWVDLYENDYFSDPRSNEEVEDFAGGEGAMYLMGEWVIGQIERAGLTPGEDFGSFIMPNMNADLGSNVIIEAGPLLVGAEAAEDEQVMDLARFWMSQANAQAWAEAEGLYTGNLKAEAPNELIASTSEQMSENDTTGLPRWWEAVPVQIQGDMVAELNRFMLDPSDETADRVMETMQALNSEHWEDQ